jgi:hypothetical protein
MGCRLILPKLRAPMFQTAQTSRASAAATGARAARRGQRSEGETNSDHRRNVVVVVIGHAGTVRNGDRQTAAHLGIRNSGISIETLREVMINEGRTFVEVQRVRPVILPDVFVAAEALPVRRTCRRCDRRAAAAEPVLWGALRHRPRSVRPRVVAGRSFGRPHAAGDAAALHRNVREDLARSSWRNTSNSLEFHSDRYRRNSPTTPRPTIHPFRRLPPTSNLVSEVMKTPEKNDDLSRP